MARFTFIFIYVFSLANLHAQESKNRYRFAQSYIGLQADYLNKASGLKAGELASPSFADARIMIGGLHFWGKADFYLSFPLYQKSQGNSTAWAYSEGVITAGRILPLGLGKKWPSPYLGVEWSNPGFTYRDGPLKFRNALSLEAGFLKVISGRWGLEAGVHYVTHQHYRYYTSRTETTDMRLPEWGFSLALKRYFDFTSGLSSDAAQKYVTRVRQKMQENGGLNSFSIALGPSATLGLSTVPFAASYPWISQRVITAVHPDAAIGYFFYKPNIEIRAAFRPLSLYQNGYGLSLTQKQQRFSLEGIKFLFDYNGFVPFAGISAGATHFAFTAKDKETLITQKKEWLPSYALVFGWDIRPTDVEWLILRTNLRYMPALHAEVQGSRLTSSQLEINFIQLVFYPERYIRHRQTSKS